MLKYSDTHQLIQAHDVEINKLNKNKVIQWLPDHNITPGIKKLKPINLTMIFRDKTDPKGTIMGEEQGAVSGDMMNPHLHYNNNEISAYDAKKHHHDSYFLMRVI